MSKPKIPAPPPPPQEVKTPDNLGTQRRKRQGPAGTMLTGPSGITTGSLNTGGNTLLGG